MNLIDLRFQFLIVRLCKYYNILKLIFIFYFTENFSCRLRPYIHWAAPPL